MRDWRGATKGRGCCPTSAPHLHAARFWFGDVGEDYRLVSVNRFDNLALDYVVVASEAARPKLEFEMTLLSWRIG